MKNAIVNAVASKEGYTSSPQLRNRTYITTYYMNSYVSLRSAKVNNPESDCILVVNHDLPEKWVKMFQDAEIRILVAPFDNFDLSNQFSWALAFYKLSALYTVVMKGVYDKCLLLDTDTYVSHSLDDLFAELENDDIMLYNIGHSISHKDRKVIIDNYYCTYGKKVNITHYGGEIIGGTQTGLLPFMNQCLAFFNEAKLSGKIDITTGDEYIISAVAETGGYKVRSAEPYIYRYWTGGFNLVSTNWNANARSIWHVPNEKESGMLMLFLMLCKHRGYLLCDKKVARILGFPFGSTRVFFNNLKRRISRRVFEIFLLQKWTK